MWLYTSSIGKIIYKPKDSNTLGNMWELRRRWKDTYSICSYIWSTINKLSWHLIRLPCQYTASEWSTHWSRFYRTSEQATWSCNRKDLWMYLRLERSQCPKSTDNMILFRWFVFLALINPTYSLCSKARPHN